jgi:hypothetical protein
MFVEKNARYALQADVFSADQLESALDTLIAKDRPLPDASRCVAGETACSLDMTQYLFGVGEPDGGRMMKPERIARMQSLINDDDAARTATAEEMASLTPERVTKNFTDYYQRYTEMARQGYPTVRASDVEEMAKPYADDNCVSRVMLPSLSRCYQLATRAEASRRATQLTYAVHLYKARTGQWPRSLDDLPARHTEGSRTDPFSGQDFVYRPSDAGFTLYSTSENGSDDGGTHHSRWGDGDSPGSPSDDFVFWPPQQ